jgi:HEPN superfamily RiboL-PSP-like protein
MDENASKQLQIQLNSIIDEYQKYKDSSIYDDMSDISYSVHHNLITRSRSAVQRISGKKSPYDDQLEEILSRNLYDGVKLPMVIGVVQSLLFDLKSGYLSTLAEMIHGDLFGDFLEMADYLLSEGYKDAAAVITGGTLETHLKQLCIKLKIDTKQNVQNSIRPKKTDTLNSELVKASAYSKLDQKSVTSWLDLRNKAAHGNYNEYTEEQVKLLINSVRDFISRNPG